MAEICVDYTAGLYARDCLQVEIPNRTIVCVATINTLPCWHHNRRSSTTVPQSHTKIKLQHKIQEIFCSFTWSRQCRKSFASVHRVPCNGCATLLECSGAGKTAGDDEWPNETIAELQASTAQPKYCCTQAGVRRDFVPSRVRSLCKYVSRVNQDLSC